MDGISNNRNSIEIGEMKSNISAPLAEFVGVLVVIAML
jgi:hypothetical protein